MKNFSLSNVNGGGFSLKSLVDTLTCTIRIRLQMKDIGSYEVYEKVNSLKSKVDSILNPDKKDIERLCGLIDSSPKKKKNYL